MGTPAVRGVVTSRVKIIETRRTVEARTGDVFPGPYDRNPLLRWLYPGLHRPLPCPRLSPRCPVPSPRLGARFRSDALAPVGVSRAYTDGCLLRGSRSRTPLTRRPVLGLDAHRHGGQVVGRFGSPSERCPRFPVTGSSVVAPHTLLFDSVEPISSVSFSVPPYVVGNTTVRRDSRNTCRLFSYRASR